MLDIVDCRKGQFLTANGQIQAFTCEISGNHEISGDHYSDQIAPWHRDESSPSTN
jgi:hypothetical protein